MSSPGAAPTPSKPPSSSTVRRISGVPTGPRSTATARTAAISVYATQSRPSQPPWARRAPRPPNVSPSPWSICLSPWSAATCGPALPYLPTPKTSPRSAPPHYSTRFLPTRLPHQLQIPAQEPEHAIIDWQSLSLIGGLICGGVYLCREPWACPQSPVVRPQPRGPRRLARAIARRRGVLVVGLVGDPDNAASVRARRRRPGRTSRSRPRTATLPILMVWQVRVVCGRVVGSG